jgi:hypothetical protein
MSQYCIQVIRDDGVLVRLLRTGDKDEAHRQFDEWFGECKGYNIKMLENDVVIFSAALPKPRRD